jgi:hypothetical protein
VTKRLPRNSQAKAWKDLSPAYKKRLQRQGITAKTHRRSELNQARGHRSTQAVGAINEGTLRRIIAGEGTVSEVTGTDLLSRFTWPAWVPHTVSNQQDGFTYAVDPVVAAALSRLPDPRTWTSVEFQPAGDDEPWTMVVGVKRRKKPRTTTIPGGGGAGTGAKQVLDILTSLESQENARRMRARAEQLFINVRETDEVA